MIIVLGENIVGALYSTEEGQYTAAVYGASALGVYADCAEVACLGAFSPCPAFQMDHILYAVDLL